MDFSRLLKDWNNNYYTIPLMWIIELTTIIICIINSKKEKAKYVFLTYLVIDFCILLVGFYVQIDPSISRGENKAFFTNTNVIIALVEITIYYYFFHLLGIYNNKKILTGLYITYLFCVFIYFSKKINFIASTPIHGTNIVGAIEFILLLPPCFLYYKHLLKTTSILTISERPSFWIITGIFFYSLVSIPYYLLMSYFTQTRYEYKGILSAAFYYIPFTINFIFLSKAFLCKKPLTT